MISLFNTIDKSYYEEVINPGNINEIIAIIPITGEITSQPLTGLFNSEEVDMTTKVLNKLDKAIENNYVKAIILDINSPGGEVYATELITNKVKEAKTYGKVVIALLRDMGASGGYYIASAADKIVASESTITGSIGVILQTQDLSGLYEKLGIKTYLITNSKGDFKVIKGDLDDTESDAYKLIQRIADDTYDMFIENVAEGRSMTKDEVIAIADGRIYSGKQALNLNLIDKTGYLNDAIDLASEKANLSNPKVIEYKNIDYSWSSLNVKLAKAFGVFSQLNNTDYSTLKVLYQVPF